MNEEQFFKVFYALTDYIVTNRDELIKLYGRDLITLNLVPKKSVGKALLKILKSDLWEYRLPHIVATILVYHYYGKTFTNKGNYYTIVNYKTNALLSFYNII